MSILYDQYLVKHKKSVENGLQWLQTNLPDLIPDKEDVEWQLLFNHDSSKTNQDEYNAYDAYFYGGNKSFKVVRDFNKAWLFHIHRNPHHWQHWILINDDPNEGEIILEMPYVYVIEMICDWWTFSWSSGNLKEIFKWYDGRKDYIKLHPNTRSLIENILSQIESKIDTLMEVQNGT